MGKINHIINHVRKVIGGTQLASIDELRKTGMEIGQGCEIYTDASFGSEPYLISLGNYVRVNKHVEFVTHDGGMWVIRHMQGKEDYMDGDIFGKIEVGNNVHIGTGATIMPGVTIGNNVIIGCGAIVSRDIPDNSVAVGIPARVIENIEEYFNKNKDVIVHTKNMNYDEKKKFLMKANATVTAREK